MIPDIKRATDLDEWTREALGSEDPLTALRKLYVKEKRLRRVLRQARRIRIGCITALAVLVPLLAAWALLSDVWIVRLAGLAVDAMAYVGKISLGSAAIAAALLTVMVVLGVIGMDKHRLDRVIAVRESLLDGSGEKSADYVERTRIDLVGYQDAARRLRWTNSVMQVVVIVGSLAAATLAGVGGDSPGLRWFAVIAGALASLAASLMSFFKFKDRSFSLDQAGASIQIELNSYDLNGGRYRSLEEDDKRAELVDAIERIRIDLWQREAAIGTDTPK